MTFQKFNPADVWWVQLGKALAGVKQKPQGKGQPVARPRRPLPGRGPGCRRPEASGATPPAGRAPARTRAGGGGGGPGGGSRYPPATAAAGEARGARVRCGEARRVPPRPARRGEGWAAGVAVASPPRGLPCREPPRGSQRRGFPSRSAKICAGISGERGERGAGRRRLSHPQTPGKHLPSRQLHPKSPSRRVVLEPVHKMNRQQYQSLLKKMCMPVVRGPENRYDFASFEEKNSHSFLKFNQFTPPVGLNYPLFPHRGGVPLVDPCLGFVSPGADADLQPSVGRAMESLVDYSDVKPHQRVPITRKRGQPACRRPMILLEENSGDRRWNSRAVSTAFESSDPSARAYEEVPWDNRSPSKIQPPESTVLADPVSQCFTKRRYNLESEISQVAGGLWDRYCTRSFTSPQRPVDLNIDMDMTCVGAVNFEDTDNTNVDLIPLNHVQTSKAHASTAHTSNIPGYTSKVHWSATHPANSNLPSTTPSIIAQMHGYIAKHGSSSYNQQGLFSQMVTPVSPQNSFNKTE
ncbi:LOW QUALITY PROTEIN: protein SPMIP7 [Chlamydotis macqueenii]